MRHRRKFNHLSRKSQHRKAMLSNMAASLILHKRINTTLAKAKALRSYVEPLITSSKNDTTHSRRHVFSYLQNKDAVSELFREVSVKVADRPGGYTRIIKLGTRLGDSAEMCLIELVDYNENLLAEKETTKAKSPRTRRAGRKKATTPGEKQVDDKKKLKEPAAKEQAKPDKAESEPTPPVETKEEKTAQQSETKEDVTEQPVEAKQEKPEQPKEKDEVKEEAEKGPEPKSETKEPEPEDKTQPEEKEEPETGKDKDGAKKTESRVEPPKEEADEQGKKQPETEVKKEEEKKTEKEDKEEKTEKDEDDKNKSSEDKKA